MHRVTFPDSGGVPEAASVRHYFRPGCSQIVLRTKKYFVSLFQWDQVYRQAHRSGCRKVSSWADHAPMDRLSVPAAQERFSDKSIYCCKSVASQTLYDDKSEEQEKTHKHHPCF